MRRHDRQRGQALIETTLAMPLFLLCFFGMMWAFKVAILDERTQLSVRYAGLISQTQDPLIDYSAYSMYNNLNGQALVTDTACPSPEPGIVQGNAAGGTSPITGVPFWQSSAAPAPGSTCGETTLTGGFTRPFTVLHSDLNVGNAQSGTLISSLGNVTLGAEQNFFKSVDMSTMLHCYPSMEGALTASLMPSTDATAATPLAPLPLAGTTISTVVTPNGTC